MNSTRRRTTRRRTGVVTLATMASLLAGVGVAGAQEPAAPPPAAVGRSGGEAELLRLRLGADALDLRVLTESSETVNDPAAGDPEAVERLTALTVSSSLVPGVEALSTPPIESRSRAGEQSVAGPGVDLADHAAAAPVPGLLTGSLDAGVLRSVVDDRGALAALEGAASDLAILGGLLRLDGAELGLGSSAFTDAAGAVRGVRAERVEVLDLDALLQALGISLADLPVGTAAQLLEVLGLPLPGGLSAAQLVGTVTGAVGGTGATPADVDALRQQVGTLQSQLAPLTAQLDALTGERATATGHLEQLRPLTPTCDPAAPVLGALGIGCPDVPPTIDVLDGRVESVSATVDGLVARIDDLQARIDDLLAQIDGLLGGVTGALPLADLTGGLLDALETAPLLVLEDVEIGMLLSAAPTVADSVAELTGSIGSFRIGDVAVPGVDALAGADAVNAVAGQLTDAVGQVLAVIDPALAGLVDVQLLLREGGVSGEDGATEATGSLTGLRLGITPPDLCGVLGALAAPAPALGPTLGSLVGSLGAALPALPLGPAGILGGLGSGAECDAAGDGAATADAAGDAAEEGEGEVARAAGDGPAASPMKAALDEPLTVDAFTVRGMASYAVPAQEPEDPPAGALARTGVDTVTFVVTGVGVLLGAVWLRRLTLAAR